MTLPYSAYFLILFVGLPLGLYALMSFKYRQPLSLKRYRMAFYSTNLDPAVCFARHALSIDENRKDFPRVPWAEEPSENALVSDTETKPERFKQIWFAGNHSDIGGSYTENESRLSDVALTWMLEEALSLPEPIKVDREMLNLYPSSAGPQHDERQRVIDSMSPWLRRVLTWILPTSRVGWVEGHRPIPNDAPLHPSVIERFSCKRVLMYGDCKAYRPGNLRSHNDVRQFYS